MIMAIDVSNTNITLGTFKGEKLLKIYRVTTKVPRTSDEYGVLLRDLVRLSNASHHDIEGVIIASVVPNVMYSLTNACIKYFHVHPVIVGPGVKTGRFASGRSRALGAWRRAVPVSSDCLF